MSQFAIISPMPSAVIAAARYLIAMSLTIAGRVPDGSYTAVAINEIFCPPNPKLFDNTVFSFFSRGVFGT